MSFILTTIMTLALTWSKLTLAIPINLPCQLEWVQYEKSDTALLDRAIRIDHSSSHLISRSKIAGLWQLGLGDELSGKASFTSNGKLLERFDFQILTNPNNCAINWTPFLDANSCNFVPISDKAQTYIGRNLNSDQKKYTPCYIKNQLSAKCDEALQSSTDQVNFIVSSVDMIDPVETFEFSLGETSHYENNGDAELHRKVSFVRRDTNTKSTITGFDTRFTQDIQICKGRNCQIGPIVLFSAIVVSITLEIRFYISIDFSLYFGLDRTTTEVDTESDTDAIDVNIPAGTSVQVCPVVITSTTESTVVLNGGFSLPEERDGGCDRGRKEFEGMLGRDGLSARNVSITNQFVNVEGFKYGKVTKEGPYDFEIFVLPLNAYKASCGDITKLFISKKQYSKKEMKTLLNLMHNL
ncbi:hypothetical protein Fcan01_27811 [Folsomia candida]|uniref:Uncharacterized protein n=1 Tax=Folsomia candida TaxID=158441 RepID=A0A226CY28_FOLCA|nr:hypothetical protein Fcan01_27811 [Folsomia candida]